MGSFPQQFFSLIVTSLSISTVGMVFGGLSLTLSPIIWLIPAVIIITFSFHTYILLLGSSETYSSPRIYSPIPIGCAYVLAFLWSAALAASVTLTCLLLSGIIRSTDDKVKIWMPILSGVSLLQAMLFCFIAIQSHREMKKIRYRNKWRWRVDITGGSPSQWSIAKYSL
ncbi:hypothetical protein BDZ97DRAFT_1341570 [Flammula alnicola]|nr:hypothetical protein BDZ97DRAFT_1341570 [Flammula alnicola]